MDNNKIENLHDYLLHIIRNSDGESDDALQQEVVEAIEAHVESNKMGKLHFSMELFSPELDCIFKKEPSEWLVKKVVGKHYAKSLAKYERCRRDYLLDTAVEGYYALSESMVDTIHNVHEASRIHTLVAKYGEIYYNVLGYTSFNKDKNNLLASLYTMGLYFSVLKYKVKDMLMFMFGKDCGNQEDLTPNERVYPELPKPAKEFDIKDLEKSFAHITCPEKEFASDWLHMRQGLLYWYKNVLEHIEEIYPESPVAVDDWCRRAIANTLATAHWTQPLHFIKSAYPSLVYTDVIIDKITEDLQRIEDDVDVWSILGIKKLDWDKITEESHKKQ
jgi:hypothetical protein